MHSIVLENWDDGSKGTVVTDAGIGIYYVTGQFDGYTYSCNIDCETGEITNESVVPIENYKGKAVLHEKIEGLIGLREAHRLALELMQDKEEIKAIPFINLEKIDDEYIYYVTVVISDEFECKLRFNAVTGEVIEHYEHISPHYAFTIVLKEFDPYVGSSSHSSEYEAGSEFNVTGVDECHVWLVKDAEKDTVYHYILDAHTGEILKRMVEANTENTDEDAYEEYNEILEDVEGAIKKSEAIAIALENSGLTIRDTCNVAPKAILAEKDGSIVYIVKWQTGFGGLAMRVSDCECVVDAVSGKVISATPEVIRPDIEAESANGSYIGKKAAEDALIKDLAIDEASVTIISTDIEQFCVSATNESVEFKAVYVISFDRKRVGSDHEIAYVDAMTGEVLQYVNCVSPN